MGKETVLPIYSRAIIQSGAMNQFIDASLYAMRILVKIQYSREVVLKTRFLDHMRSNSFKHCLKWRLYSASSSTRALRSRFTTDAGVDVGSAEVVVAEVVVAGAAVSVTAGADVLLLDFLAAFLLSLVCC
jgi:hypothetical protein